MTTPEQRAETAETAAPNSHLPVRQKIEFNGLQREWGNMMAGIALDSHGEPLVTANRTRIAGVILPVAKS